MAHLFFSLHFPVVFDIKYLMTSCKTLKGGLQELADDLDDTRVGPQHQAGSDARVTGLAYFKLKEVRPAPSWRAGWGWRRFAMLLTAPFFSLVFRQQFFDGIIDNDKFNGMLFGLGTTF